MIVQDEGIAERNRAVAAEYREWLEGIRAEGLTEEITIELTPGTGRRGPVFNEAVSLFVQAMNEAVLTDDVRYESFNEDYIGNTWEWDVGVTPEIAAKLREYSGLHSITFNPRSEPGMRVTTFVQAKVTGATEKSEWRHVFAPYRESKKAPPKESL